MDHTASPSPAVMETNLPFPGRRAGKVRDVYALPDRGGVPTLLLVATDRLSAFDVVMRTPVPGKGAVLTTMARRWFEFVESRGLAPTHVLGWDVPEGVGLSAEEARMLAGRVTVCKSCEVVPVECVVRGYLEGSGWKEYRETGAICGNALPSGLRQGDRLPEPIFTPATKAELGEHDENIDFERACAIAGGDAMRSLRAMSLAIYKAGHEYARERGVILADTKFEFGYPLDADGERSGEPLTLIDEVLTADSSRYWPADRWSPGGAQESFDKQFVREYLQGLVDRGEWDKTAGADGLGPALPSEVVEGTLARYREALDRLFPG